MQKTKNDRLPRALRCRRHRVVCSRTRTSPVLDTTRFPQLPRTAFGTFESVANPCPIAETNSHDSHFSCDQCTLSCGSPVGIGVSTTTRVANVRKEFTISMLCFTTALLTHCKRHAVAPTNRIHEATEKRITRRRQPRKNSTSEILDGYQVC